MIPPSEVTADLLKVKNRSYSSRKHNLGVINAKPSGIFEK